MKEVVKTKEKRTFLKRKLIDPLLGFLRQGMSPGKLAMTVAFGTVWGTFPIIGTNTIICVGTAIAFRLNHAAIQLVNYAVYPLQLILFIPFIQLGLYMTAQDELQYSFTELYDLIKSDPLEAFGTIGNIIWSGVLGWITFAVPAFVLCILILKPLFSGIAMKNKTDAG